MDVSCVLLLLLCYGVTYGVECTPVCNHEYWEYATGMLRACSVLCDDVSVGLEFDDECYSPGGVCYEYTQCKQGKQSTKPQTLDVPESVTEWTGDAQQPGTSQARWLLITLVVVCCGVVLLFPCLSILCFCYRYKSPRYTPAKGKMKDKNSGALDVKPYASLLSVPESEPKDNTHSSLHIISSSILNLNGSHHQFPASSSLDNQPNNTQVYISPEGQVSEHHTDAERQSNSADASLLNTHLSAILDSSNNMNNNSAQDIPRIPAEFETTGVDLHTDNHSSMASSREELSYQWSGSWLRHNSGNALPSYTDTSASSAIPSLKQWSMIPENLKRKLETVPGYAGHNVTGLGYLQVIMQGTSIGRARAAINAATSLDDDDYLVRLVL